MKHLKNLVIVLAVSITITFIFSASMGGDNFSIKEFFLNVIYGIVIGGSISLSGFLSHFIINRLNVESNPLRTYIILLTAVFMYITIDVFIVNGLWYRFVYHIPFERIFLSTSIIITSIITIFIGLIIFFIILSKIYMQKFITAQRETQQAIKEAELAKFETLKAQINPHFLFNSLNALSTLIHIDTNKADEFVSKLSGIYRYVLNHQDADMVAVEKELAFAEDFADLQAIRFNQNFTLTIQKFEGSENTMIIPLSLQLLLENVFKHNIISQNKKVHISISFEDKYLVVSNNKTMTKEVKTSHAVGLSNIMNRYAVVSDQQCVVEDTNDYFTVKIPLVHVD
ncbi:MAG: hypothetical protein COW63_16735 [Bacteroidetes bacterium CG18_big_fil_WC_8_21_14_2_50_41_14]|nr:MAG: hypothetical protein COW63_16735 [Bacteroidetes bacterium CG18_big_fil_WC_8_21_14_2_50_41_14]PJB54979.1 MAG: hypothetical protein CO098_18795 [Bacteroidetes bacterium CG_4_9_14_3_um_filter_41_19]